MMDEKTLRFLLNTTSKLRAICIEQMTIEFRSGNPNLNNIDLLAQNLVDINSGIKYYTQKLLERGEE